MTAAAAAPSWVIDVAPDTGGEPSEYAVAVAERSANDLLAFTATKLDGRGEPVEGSSYRVARDRVGRWTCRCPWFRYHGRCKHAARIRELFDLPEAKMAKSAKQQNDAPTTNQPPADPPAARQPAGPGQAAPPARGSDPAPAATQPPPPPKVPAVYGAIAKVQAALSEVGIAKRQMQPGVNSRGIDDVLNALSPLLVRAGLLILPRVVSRESVERKSQKGGPLYFACVTVEYDFVAVSDGSKHVVVVSGEAMDVSDKATNKAMSAAYKYACFQAFCIPLEGTPDADSETHEPVSTQQQQQPAAPKPAAAAVAHEQNGAARQGGEDPDRAKLQADDARLAAEGLSKAGELLRHVGDQMRQKGLTWADNKADARKIAQAFEWKLVHDRMERLIDACGWSWEDLVGQLGLPEGTVSSQMTLASLREGVRTLETAKAQTQLQHALRT